MKTILIANELPALRAGLRMILRDSGIMNPIAEARNAAQALDCSKQELSLAIIDPDLPELDPVRFIQQLHERDINTPVLLFGHSKLELDAAGAARLGADGYVYSSSEEPTIAATIHTVLHGMQCFPKSAPAGDLATKMQALSRKELSVLVLLRNGLRNREIAEQLYLSEKTISAHKHSILAKLGISTIAQLIDNEVLAAACARHAAIVMADRPSEPSLFS